jgi:hypothetical protein
VKKRCVKEEKFTVKSSRRRRLVAAEGVDHFKPHQTDFIVLESSAGS